MDNAQNQPEKPTFVSREQVRRERDFFEHLSNEMLKGFRDYVWEKGEGVTFDWYVDQLEIPIRHKIRFDGEQEYSMGIPMYAMGGPLRGLDKADEMMERYGRSHGVTGFDINSRTWLEIRANNLRALVDTYNEGFMRIVKPEYCIDLDKVAEEYGYNFETGETTAKWVDRSKRSEGQGGGYGGPEGK